MKRLELFKTEAGREPFTDWIYGLEKNTRAKVMSFIKRVALGGSKNNIKAVGFGVFEVKIYYGPGYRVYFGEIGKMTMLLLVGGNKSTQDRDIRLAQMYWRSFHV